MTQFPFVESPNKYKGRARRGGAPTRARLLVVHDMEVMDGALTAENVAKNVFAKATTKTSAHFCVDRDSIVQCVSVNDTAWHAPNANADGIGVEFAGFARNTKEQWKAEDKVLDNGAQVFAECVVFGRKNGINFQVRRLSLPEVANQNGPAGFCGHIDVSNAFHNEGGHTDPGNQFPWGVFLKKVDHYVGIYTAKAGWTPRFV